MTADSVSAALLPMIEQPAPSAAISAPAQKPRIARAMARGRARGARSNFLFDASSFAAEVSEIVELGPANITTSFHLDFRDSGTMGWEHALYPLAVRDLPDGKRRVQSAIPFRDDDPFVS